MGACAIRLPSHSYGWLLLLHHTTFVAYRMCCTAHVYEEGHDLTCILSLSLSLLLLVFSFADFETWTDSKGRGSEDKERGWWRGG